MIVDARSAQSQEEGDNNNDTRYENSPERKGLVPAEEKIHHSLLYQSLNTKVQSSNHNTQEASDLNLASSQAQQKRTPQKLAKQK